jgi:hypothetical protein
LILINLQLFGRRYRELLFVWALWLNGNAHQRIVYLLRDGLTEFGLEQTMLGL